MIWNSLNKATHDSDLEHEKLSDGAAVIDVVSFIFNFEQTWPITQCRYCTNFFKVASSTT